MNNVNNRKMFRPRGARNKLNQMGGIMASSPELMGAVQRFANGASVRANSPLVRQQRMQDRRFAGNLMYPFAEATDLLVNIPAAGIQNFIKDFNYSAPGRFLGLSEYGDQPPADVASRPARQAIIDYMNTEEGPLRSTGPFRDLDVTNVVPTAEASAAAAAAAAPSVSPQTDSELEADDEAASTVTAEPSVNQNLSEAELAGLSEDELRSYLDSLQKERGVSPAERTKKDTTADALVEDAAAAVTAPGVDDQSAGEVIANTAKKLRELPGQTKEKLNDNYLELAGFKDPDATLTRQQRLERNVAMYKKLFGRDPKDIKEENGFNLAFMGFAIAAGKDPNALVNIAQGSKEGLTLFRESKKAQQAREDDANRFGLSQTLKEEGDIKAAKQRWAELKFGANKDMIMAKFKTDADLLKFAATQTLAESRLDKQLAQQLKIAEKRDATDQDRLEVQRLQAIRANLPDAFNLWTDTNPDFNWNTATDEEINTAIDESVDIARRLAPTKGKSMDPGMERPAYIQENVAKALENPAIASRIASDLKKKYEELTRDDIIRYYGEIYDQAAGTQPSAPSGSTITIDSAGNVQ